MPAPIDPNKQPEQHARGVIDAALTEAGWVVQSREEMNVAAGEGVAIREFKTDAGFADYLLYVERQPVGVIEAKRVGVTLTGIEAQTQDYAASVPKAIPVPIRPLPFLYESTGVETRFTNGLDPVPRSRKVFQFHRPATLKAWFDDALAIRKGRPGAPAAATFLGCMQHAPVLDRTGMWPAQITAVENLERSIKAGNPRALIQMATGSGKTYTAIAALYRLIKFGGARRVLFLVDRGNLGRQAYKEFQAYTTPDDGRKFTELYNVTWLSSNKIDPVNRVVITTIQRLYSMLKGEAELDPALEEGSAFLGSGGTLVRQPPPVAYSRSVPPELFDMVVIDECHRSIYSLWRQVLEYFDASLIGLTATPASNTFAFFRKNVVSEYRHEHAVRDKVNVPYEVYEIRTRITEGGSSLSASGPDHVVVGKRDRRSRAVRWETLDQDLSYTGSALDRSVVAKDQIRTVIREFKDKLFTEIFPGRTEIPKTLFFAKNDDHAEDILDVIREEFGIGNEEAAKVTYKPERSAGTGKKRASASHKPELVIQRFRTKYHPRIAVTVDMIATGTDIKPLECVVFMRSVKSQGLFEQMKGRGVRVIPAADFQAVTPDAKVKTHFVIVDAVGVMEECKSDPPILRDRGIAFERLLELVQYGNREEDILSTLAGRLDRMERRLDDDQRRVIERASGGVPLHAIVAGLLDAIDPDREDAKAREKFGLGAEQEPSAEQLEAVQGELREHAAGVLAYAPKLRDAILEVRKQQDQVLDATSLDEVLRSGPKPEHSVDYDTALVASFQEFIEQHRDEIDALQILYSRPYGERLTRVQIRELADAIKQPPYQWTTQGLWAAYEKVAKGRVRGAGGGRLWTDIVALARHALHPEGELVPFADQVRAAYAGWLAQQENKGKTFNAEQLRWLEMIMERIAGDAEVRMEDFDDVPFSGEGGLGRFYEVFGEEYEATSTELGLRTLTLTAVTNADFSDKNTKLTVTEPSEALNLWLEPGDILVQRSNTPELVGTAVMFRGPLNWAIFPDLLIRVRVATEAVAPAYIESWIRSPKIRHYFRGAARGIAGSMPKISQGTIGEVPVPVAPLAEQHRIVAEIEKHFTRLDAAVATLEGVQAKLERARASVLKAAVEGRLVPTEAELARAEGRSYEPADVLLERILKERKRKHEETGGKKKYKPPVERETEGLPNLPRGWTWASTDQLSVLIRNGYSKKPDGQGQTPILRISAVRANNVDRSDSRRLLAPLSDFLNATAHPGDLLFTRYNGTRSLVGVCGRLSGEGPIVYPDKLIRVVLIGELVDSSFVEKAANTGASRAFIEGKIRTTAGQSGVSGGDIRQIPLPLPPLPRAIAS